MILDLKDNELPPAPYGLWQLLQDAPFAFHLTGSRFMGGARPDSDWDFIAEDSEDLRKTLDSLGFSEDILQLAKYGGQSSTHTNAVFEYYIVSDDFSEQVKVQVQVVRSLVVRLKVRDIVAEYLFDEHLKCSREERAYIWQALDDVVSYKAGDDPILRY